MPRRQPRKPSIGLNSCSCSTRCVDFLGGDAELLAELGLLLRRVRQELVERRVEKTNRRRISVQRLEDAGEVVPLIRQQLGECRLPCLDGLGQNHLTHRVDTVALEEHVLGAAEADADGAERDGVLRLLRRVGIRAHGHPRRLAAPLHELLETLEFFRLLRGGVVFDKTGDDFRRASRQPSCVHPAGRAVDRQPVAFFKRLFPTLTVRAW